MLRVIGRQLSFGDGVTTFAYQVLIDRQVIFSVEVLITVCPSAALTSLHFRRRGRRWRQRFVVIDKGRSAARLC